MYGRSGPVVGWFRLTRGGGRFLVAGLGWAGGVRHLVSLCVDAGRPFALAWPWCGVGPSNLA